MSIHRWAAKRDGNEAEIIRALRDVGAEVWPLSGPGRPDVLVLFRGRFYAGEIKTANGRLRPTQGAFPIWRSVDDALQAIGAICQS
jgi:hypothetical protein